MLSDPLAGRKANMEDGTRRANAAYMAEVFAPWMRRRLAEGGEDGEGGEGKEQGFICGSTFSAADVVLGHCFSHDRVFSLLRHHGCSDGEVAPLQAYADTLRARQCFRDVYG